MSQPDKATAPEPRRMVPHWTVRHGRLMVAWRVSRPRPPEPARAKGDGADRPGEFDEAAD